jgi:hypothetical protein
MCFLEYSYQRNAYLLREIDAGDTEKLERERIKLEEMIDSAQEKNVILSCSEYIGDLDIAFADTREMAVKLDAVTRKYPRKIIVYIRRQDIFIESTYAQYVKQGASYSFAEFLQQFDVYRFDWFRLLGLYREYFGEQDFVIRPYEKGQLYKGDVVSDFYHTIGIESLDSLQKHNYSNRGYSPAGLEIARAYNRIYARNPDKKIRMKNRLQNRMPKQHYDDFYFFSYEERKKILAFYEESNHKLATEYLHKDNGLLFEDGLEEYASTPIRKNGLTLADIWEWSVAFFIRPLKAKFHRILSG